MTLIVNRFHPCRCSKSSVLFYKKPLSLRFLLPTVYRYVFELFDEPTMIKIDVGTLSSALLVGVTSA